MSDTADELELYWDQGNGNWVLKGTYSSDGVATFDHLFSSHTYQFKARQRRSGDNQWSYYNNILSITTKSPPQPVPDYVRDITALGDWISKITLTWYSPTNWIDGGWYYKI